MTREKIFENCTISIADEKGKTYYFEKPEKFQCELLKVRYDRYHNIIAMVITEYNNAVAICYSTTGYVYDGREGFNKFTLTPTTMEEFFKEEL